MATHTKDWNCSKCGFDNFASRIKCKECYAPKPCPGDWECSTCHASNFAHRQQCFKCNSPHPNNEIKIEPKPKQSHAGDWKCSKCNFDNFGTRVVCLKCETIRSDITTKSICCICMDKPTTICISTCGHFCMCSSCASTQTTCPICRTPYTSNNMITTFIP
jgi:hypothetical protein